jgi:hypothetical protein
MENLKGRYYAEYLGLDGRIILEWIVGKQGGGVDWIHRAQDRDQWRPLVNTVMNLPVA